MYTIDLNAPKNHVFLSDCSHEMTYDELLKGVTQACEALRCFTVSGITAIQISSRFDFAVVTLALLHLGHSALLINPSYTKNESERLLRDVPVGLFITNKVELLESDLPGTEIWPTSRLFVSTPSNTMDPKICLSGEILMCTSGSTGQPRIIARTGEAIFHEMEAILERINYCQDDRIFSLAQWTHALGFVLHFMLGIRVKARLITASSMNTPSNWMKKIEREEVTVLVGVPTFYSYLLQAPVHNLNLKLAVCAGAALPKDVFDAFKTKLHLPISHYYGCTEAGAITMPSSSEKSQFPSVGKPLSHVRIRILDDTGAELGPGEIGRIHLYSKSLAHRVWQEGNFSIMERDYETGDQGYLSDRGELTIIGRNSQRIKVNGLQVLPGEIESVLEQHPSVLEAVIIPRADKQRGSVLVAYLRVLGEAPNVLALRAFCEERLTPHKIPHQYRFVKEFDRDEKGAVRRSSLE